MKEWILIVQLMSPGGDYMDKVPVLMPSKQACEAARKELPPPPEHPLGIKARGVCVTRAHWEGRKPMKDVPLD